MKSKKALETSYETFSTVMDSMDALVYVADIKTYEVLFVNKYARDIFGDAVGKVCWQTFQKGQSGPCDFCTNKHLLSPDGMPVGVYSWEFNNTVNGRWYEIRDRAIPWVDGRIVRLEIAVDITERKQAESGRLRFLNALEASLNEIYIFNPDTLRFEYVNAGALRNLGYTGEEMQKMTPLDIKPEFDEASFRKLIVPLLDQKKEKLIFQSVHRRADGSLYPVEVHLQLIEQEQEKFFLAVILDITERKRIEKALLETNELLEKIFANIHIMIAYMDKDFNIIRVNRAYAEADERTQEFFVGKNHFDLYPSEENEAIFQKVVETGEPYFVYEKPFEYAEHPERGITYWDWSLHPVKEADDKISGVVLSLVNVTKRKHAEELVRNILETVDEGFIIIDRDFRIVSANRAYCEQVNLPMEDVINRHCYEVSHHINRPCHEAGEDCAVRHVFEAGEPYSAIHIHMDKDNNPVYVETKGYPMKDAMGKVVSAIEIVNNITEKKKLEAQLRQAQKMESIGQLAGGIAHDFNNILTAIIGYGSLLRTNMSKEDPLISYVEQVLASSEKAANLTQSLLAFSRKQIISPKPVNLNEVIKRIEKLLLRLIGEDIELKTMLADKDLTVMADSGQIEQVLMNLATNAKDAMPDGGLLTIETEIVELDKEYIKTHAVGKAGVYALISVTDTGIGMDEKTRERIFEPFFTTKELGKGTGLGLAMVYGIIKQHNGYINVYSEPGRGTTFRIYIPLIKSELKEVEAPALPAPMGGTETVLIAEDDAEVRKLTKEVLEGFGYKVIEAVNGVDAINKFMANKDVIRILLFDLIMPKKNGREAYEEIRKTSPDIKVLFTSGYTADIIHDKGILEEGINFISKPVLPDDLLRKIREVLDK